MPFRFLPFFEKKKSDFYLIKLPSVSQARACPIPVEIEFDLHIHSWKMHVQTSPHTKNKSLTNSFGNNLVLSKPHPGVTLQQILYCVLRV